MRKRSRPILIYDGECRFCCRWIERWKEATRGRVDYAPSQEVAEEFPEITEEDFARSVQWVNEDGGRLSGAAAVFAALARGSWMGRALQQGYESVPGAASLCEAAYGMVAKHRMAFSLLTRWLWGNDVRQPTYAIAANLFLRLLGLVYLIAFVSYAVQWPGLTGSQGLQPAGAFFHYLAQAYGGAAFWENPSLCWFASSDAAMRVWCGAGILLSVLLMAGIAPVACLVGLWINYLSLVVAGGVFYSFQWDTLLLEAGFMAIFLAPLRLWMGRATNPPRAAHFLLLWLLFRLMFSSGVVKLAYGDPAWADGSALQYHYFTQPLPTPVAWHAELLPPWFQYLSVKIMFAIEIGLPFLLFAPRRLRLLAVLGLLSLQCLIALTGNYGFFNLLTATLCLLAVDDAVWRKIRRRPARETTRGRYLPRFILYPATIAIVLVSLVPLAFSFRVELPSPLMAAYTWIEPFRTINSYGLFRVMTHERLEIAIQGSDDGTTWKDYPFRFKPGDLRRAPPWVEPYMPRLDWQMWFAALSSLDDNPWLRNVFHGLLKGSPPVLGLFAANPFPGHPPRYVRAIAAPYTFTTPAAIGGKPGRASPTRRPSRSAAHSSSGSAPGRRARRRGPRSDKPSFPQWR